MRKFDPRKPDVGEKWDNYFKYLSQYIVKYFEELVEKTQRQLRRTKSKNE